MTTMTTLTTMSTMTKMTTMTIFTTMTTETAILIQIQIQIRAIYLFSDLVTQLTITGKLRHLNHDIEGSHMGPEDNF